MILSSFNNKTSRREHSLSSSSSVVGSIIRTLLPLLLTITTLVVLLSLQLSPHVLVSAQEAAGTQGWNTWAQGTTPDSVDIASVRQGSVTGIAYGGINIYARNFNVRITPNLVANDRNVLPGQCESDVDQPYGWNTYREHMMGSIVASNPRSGNSFYSLISIQLNPRIGYSTSTTETITCTLTKPPGEPSVFNTAPTDQDKFFSFVITAGTRNQLYLLKDFNRKDLNNFDAYNFLPSPPIQAAVTSSNGDIYESDIRQKGLIVDIVIDGDFWIQKNVGLLTPYIKCRAILDETGPDCMQGIIQSTDLSWNETFPSIISLRVPRDRMRNFNINQVSKFFIDIPPEAQSSFSRLQISLGVNAGFLIFAMPVRRGSEPQPPVSSPEVELMGQTAISFLDNDGLDAMFTNKYVQRFGAFVTSAYPNNTMTITEDQMRGQFPNGTRAFCPLAFLFNMKNKATTVGAVERHRFTSGVTDQLEDIRRYAFSSKNGFPFGDVYWLQRFLLSATQPQSLICLTGVEEYETATNDEITVNLPFSSFTSGEPMIPDPATQPIRIIVTPSRGTFVGDLHDINQSAIWFTNVTLCLKLAGESFKPSIANDLLSARSSGNISVGWNTQKDSLINGPGGRVFFRNFSSGVVDYTTLCFTLAQNIGYEMQGGKVERITFSINDTWIQSTGLPLQYSANPYFDIIGSPGEYTLIAPATVEESTMILGGYTMRLELAGQKFLNDTDACARAICQSWNSSSGGVDTRGFRARNPVICNPFTSFTRVNERTLDIVFAPDPLYDTIRGETITTLVPTECTGGVVPKGRPTFEILPQNGNMSFELSFDNGQTMFYANETIEANIRSARCIMYLKIFNDTWDATNPNLTDDILNSFVSLQNEPYGWNNKKNQLVQAVTVMNETHVRINFVYTPTYDITNNETLEITIAPEWVGSRRAPQNPTMSFKVLASAGDVELLSWTGSAENRDITEDDIRWGRLWFEFSLSGDQWRRDVGPFMRSFTSNQAANPNSVHNLIPQLVPSIQFFKFRINPTNGAEILTLRLQSSDLYDVAADENVTLRFDPETVASGISPFFFVNNESRSGFWFYVRKTSSRVIMSGEIHSLDEKKMRQSLELKIFFTLIGETWKQGLFKDNTTSSLVELLNVIRDPYVSDPATAPPIQQNGFVAFKASIIPKSRVEYVKDNILLLHFLPNRNYEIETNEYLETIVPLWTVSSNLKPYTNRLLDRLIIRVVPTGGELRLLPQGLVLDEAQLRDSNFTVLIAVDGDRWSQNNLLDQSVSFVATAFGSLSSIISEPTGFSALKEDFLNIGGSRRPFLSSGSFSGRETLQVRLNPVPRYDISADETILFSVIDPVFLSTGFLPEPNRVEIPVRASPRVIVLVIEQLASKAIAYRTNLGSLKNELTSIMGVPADRQKLELNKTAIRADGRLAVLLNFLPATSAAMRETDPRSIIELSDTFLSIHPDYLYQRTAIRFAFRQDRAPPDSALVVTPPPTKADNSNKEDDSDLTIVIAVVGSVFIVLMALGFVIGLRLQRATVSTSAIKASRQRRRDVGAERFHDDEVMRREQVIELSIDPRLRRAGTRLKPTDDKDHTRHWDPDEDLHIIPTEPSSLRDHVRGNLGIKDPTKHLEQMKRDRFEREFNERLYSRNTDGSPNSDASTRSKYYEEADFAKGRRSTSPLSPMDSKFEAPKERRKEFKINSRGDLKRLERLMAL